MGFLCAGNGGGIAFLCGRDDFGGATRGSSMYDVLFVALGIAGFAVCVGYVYLCDRL